MPPRDLKPKKPSVFVLGFAGAEIFYDSVSGSIFSTLKGASPLSKAPPSAGSRANQGKAPRES